MKKCAYPTASGETCTKPQVHGSDFCRGHRDLVNQMRNEARQVIAAEVEEAEPADPLDAAEEGPSSALPREEREYFRETVAAAEAEDAASFGGDPTRASGEAIVDQFRKAKSETTAERLPRRTRSPKPSALPDEADPVQKAQLLVQVHLAREAERRFKRGSGARDRDGFRTKEGEDEVTPWMVIPRIREIDETAPVDPITGEYPADIKPGWVTHWVSMRDDHDRPTTSRLAKRQRYGYVTVKDEEGDPIEGRLGMLMQAPPQSAAAYTLAGMPQGAMKRDEALAQAQDIDADLQAYGGESLGGIVVEQEHRHKRGTVAGINSEFPE